MSDFSVMAPGPSTSQTRRNFVKGGVALFVAGAGGGGYFLLQPEVKVRVVLVRGLLGWFFSTGMYTLAEKLNKIPGVHATVHTFAGDSQALTKILIEAAAKGQRIVSIGHSMGGDEVVKVAEDLQALGMLLDLCGPVDGTRQNMHAIPASVDECVSFYQRYGAQFGQGIAVRAANNKRTKMTVTNMGAIGHTQIDKANGVHNAYVAKVKALSELPKRVQKPKG